jgi:hypothetical protein
MHDISAPRDEGLLDVALTVALSTSLANAPMQEEKPCSQNERGPKKAELRRRPGAGIEERCWDDVLDLGCSGQRVHGEAQHAQRQRRRQKPLGDLSLFEHLRRNG